MKTFIEVTAKSRSGKSQSIILAARKAFASGATLVAKYYRGTAVDIVEIYRFGTGNSAKYVAYASAGDTKKVVYENLYALRMFEEVACENKHIADYEGKELDVSLVTDSDESKRDAEKEDLCIKLNMPHCRNAYYKNMEKTLKGIGKDFVLDIIIMACHPDGVRQESDSLKAIKEYAQKYSYAEETYKVHESVPPSKDNMLNDIAGAICKNSEEIDNNIKEKLAAQK